MSCEHIGIFTNDMERAILFYTELMGFVKQGEEMLTEELMLTIFGIPSPSLFVKLEAKGVKIELFQPLTVRLEERRDNLTGYNHWAFIADDRDELCRRLEEKKGALLKFWRNDHYVYFVTDPDGNRIEIRY